MASELKIKVNGHVHSVTATWDIVAFELTHFAIPGIIDLTQGRWFYFASPTTKRFFIVSS